MSARAWLSAVAGTAVLVFVLPYVLPAISLAPNGTETMLLVVLLLVCIWGRDRWRSRKSVSVPPRQGQRR
ncbi:hypothetical protein J2T22_001623 [Pseudarthrobacter defluvii]|uniref:MYXO-CTERM domain-containing protein n=1 Tax=Pseudarthrobacter defluvii TaxID=410837 RepID=A0ABT9UFM8_9MICC|nr:hypothetical protein [Pseudarthrobacter defluvii]